MLPKWLAVGWLLRGIRKCFSSSSVLLPSSSCLLFTAICALISYSLLHPRGSPPFSLLLTTAISRRGRYTASLTRKPKLGDWEGHPSPSKIQCGHSSSCRVGQNLQDSESKREEVEMTEGPRRMRIRISLWCHSCNCDPVRSQQDPQARVESKCFVTECFLHTVSAEVWHHTPYSDQVLAFPILLP